MAKEYPYPSGEGNVKWISPGWLDDHLQDDLIILDVQPNIHDYILEHIPGANYLNEEFLRCSNQGLCGTFMPPEAVEQYYRRVGIRPDRKIVVYTGQGGYKKWGDGLEQTMMAYGLARFGHDNILVLDGGLEGWKEAGGKVTKEFPEVESTDYRASVRHELFIRYDEFKRVKDDENVVLLDARPAAVYEGQGPWRKPGHIPGAISFPWASLMTKENTRKLRSDDELKELTERVGATKDRDIICSCGTGREATNELLLFKYYLGYPSVRIFEGSFTEWTAHPENPTVVGKSPYGESEGREQVIEMNR